MGCNSPILMKDKQGRIFKVPCRKCEGCREASIRQWTARAKWEIDKMYKEHNRTSSFITLTYREDTLPIDGSLRDKDRIDFLKRVRKYYWETYKIRIKGLGGNEYGDQFGRPHFHMVLIGVQPQEEPTIHAIWGKGQVKSGMANPTTIRYCIKYIQKQLTEDEMVEAYDDNGLERPKVWFSRGIGEDYMIQNYEMIREQGGIIDGDSFIPISRYYKEKMGICKQEGKISPKLKEILQRKLTQAESYGMTLEEWEEYTGVAKEISLRVKKQAKGQKGVYNPFSGNIQRAAIKNTSNDVDKIH